MTPWETKVRHFYRVSFLSSCSNLLVVLYCEAQPQAPGGSCLFLFLQPTDGISPKITQVSWSRGSWILNKKHFLVLSKQLLKKSVFQTCPLIENLVKRPLSHENVTTASWILYGKVSLHPTINKISHATLNFQNLCHTLHT